MQVTIDYFLSQHKKYLYNRMISNVRLESDKIRLPLSQSYARTSDACQNGEKSISAAIGIDLGPGEDGANTKATLNGLLYLQALEDFYAWLLQKSTLYDDFR